MRDTRDVKATGLEGDASPEIIEILDDDTNAFGDRAHTLTVNDTGGPRWIGPVAVAALVAIMGYGVATSASSSRTPKAEPATSTSVASSAASPTTVPAPSTTVEPPPPVPHYGADPPPEFTLQNAEPLHFDSAPAGSHYELWATTGATASSGSWFSIESHAGATFESAVNAQRKQIGDLSIAISHMPGSQTIAQFSLERAAVTITSFGWDDESIARLSASIETDGDSVSFADAWFTTDHRMLSTVHPWLAVLGNVTEQVSYTSADPSVIDIIVASRPQPNDGGATVDRQIALRFLLDRSTPFGADGHSALAGVVVGQTGFSLATWIDGQNIVTVGALMPVPQLIAVARTVHQVSSAEWEDMRSQASRHIDNGGNSVDEGQEYAVSFGTDANSEPWTIRVTMEKYGDQRQLVWTFGYASVTTPDDTPQINTVVDDTHTYVLADLPRAVAATAELHIFRDGLDTVTVPFIDVEPELDRTFAAYAFSEPLPYTAAIVAADGSVLATWPSP